MGPAAAGQLAALPIPRLETRFSEADAQWLYKLARGCDTEEVGLSAADLASWCCRHAGHTLIAVLASIPYMLHSRGYLRGKGNGALRVVDESVRGAAGMLPVITDNQEQEELQQPECAGHCLVLQLMLPTGQTFIDQMPACRSSSARCRNP